MELAADLHLHSRHAGGVSPAMTLLAIAEWAQRKGLDLIGTGDCLQEDWLREIERRLEPAEPGLFRLTEESAAAVDSRLAPKLRRPLRFVLSTEVHSDPSGTPRLGGIHHLIYFPSLESVRGFRSRLENISHLGDGRPALNLASRQILELVLQHGQGLKFAPAHLFNPWYSSLGTISGARSLAALFGELTAQLFAAELGLTSTPAMCRRMSTLDPHPLFCCSDAHSMENLGREYMLLDMDLSYAGLFAALQADNPARRRGLVKFPVARSQYYPNWCGHCQEADFGSKCPRCGRPLVTGSRDRLEAIADRTEPILRDSEARCQQLLPLAHLLSEVMALGLKSKSVAREYHRLIAALGNERYILTQASAAEIAAASTPQIARRIEAQRVTAPGSQPAAAASSRPRPAGEADQLSFGL